MGLIVIKVRARALLQDILDPVFEREKSANTASTPVVTCDLPGLVSLAMFSSVCDSKRCGAYDQTVMFTPAV